MEDDFAKSLTTDARVKVDAMPEDEFYAKQTGFVEQLRALGLAVAPGSQSDRYSAR